MKMKPHIILLALLLWHSAAFADTTLQRRAVALMLQGVQMMEEGKNDAARKLLEAARICDGENDAVQYYLGCLDAAGRDAASALEHFTAAWQRDSGNYWYNLSLAKVYSTLGRVREAEKINNRLLAMNPGDAEVLSYCVDIALQTGHPEKADSLLSRIDMMMGPSDYSRMTRLEILRQKGDFKALFAGLKDLFSSPDMPAKGKKDLIENMIKSGDPRFNYAHLADYDSLVSTCVRTHPHDTAVLHYAAGFYYSLKHFNRVLELCSSCPDDAQMTLVKMYTLSAMKEYRQALRSCDKLISLSEGNVEDCVSALLLKAECYQRLEQHDAAFREFEKALRIKPDDLVLLNNYAYSLSEAGRSLSKAAKMSRKVIAAQGENATYLDTYAWIMYKQKKYDAAKLYLKKAMLYGGKESPEILDHYACVLDALGESVLAAGYRQQAIIKRDGKQK